MASPAIGVTATPITSVQDPTTTTGITTSSSGSSFFVMFSSGSGSTVTDVTDSKLNTYVSLANVTDTNEGKKLWVYYAVNGTGGDSHTFTVNLSGNSLCVTAIEVTGAATSSIIDVSNSTWDTGGTPFNCSVTPTVDDTLVLGFACYGGVNNSGSYTVNGGFTSGQAFGNTGAGFVCAWGYKAVATAAATDPAWTHSTATNNHMLITAAIKPAAAAAGQPTMRRFGGIPGMTPGGNKFGRSWKESACGVLFPERGFA